MKKIALLLVMIFNIGIYAQNDIKQIGDFNTENFPTVKFKINLSNPDVKNADDFLLSENNKKRDFELKLLPVKVVDSTKNILIIWEDMTHSSHSLQFDTFKYILKKSIPGFVNQGDKVNIAIFDRNRKGKTPLRFLLEDYTDDIDKLITAIDDYKRKNDRFSNQISSDLYNSIYDGIKKLKNDFPNKNKAILVLSAGKNLEISNYNSIGDIIIFARKNKVPVYSLQYMLWEHENIDALANESYGKFFHIQGTYKLNGNHSKDAAVDSVIDFLNNSPSRYQGQNYLFTYDSEYKKDGKLHTVELKVDDSKKTLNFKVPNCDLICIFKEKPYIYGGSLFGFLLLLLLFLLWRRKKKKKEKKLEELKQMEVEEMLRKQEEEIEMQKEKAKMIEQKVASEREWFEKQKRLQEQKKQQKLLEEQQKQIIKEIKQTGGFPRLIISSGNDKFEYNIFKPETTIGRNANNDIQLNDTYVSGNHIKIYFDNGDFYLRDLNSRNGTLIGKKKVTTAKLQHTNVIVLGKTNIMFIR